MADNDNRKKTGDLTAEDAVGMAGLASAGASPFIGVIVGSLFVADLIFLGGISAALIAGYLKEDGDDSQK